MKFKISYLLIPSVLLILFNCIGFSQTNTIKSISNSLVKDSITKKEIDFILKHKSLTTDFKGELKKMDLKTYNTFSISDSAIVLERGNFIAMEGQIRIKIENFDTTKNTVKYADNISSTIENINHKPFWGVSNDHPKKIIKSIRYRFHNYYHSIYIPDSALSDVFEPQLYIPDNKSIKSKKLAKTNYKVFRSNDRKRIYVYMLNGNDNNKYEVIWLIENRTYYGRIINII